MKSTIFNGQKFKTLSLCYVPSPRRKFQLSRADEKQTSFEKTNLSELVPSFFEIISSIDWLLCRFHLSHISINISVRKREEITDDYIFVCLCVSRTIWQKRHNIRLHSGKLEPPFKIKKSALSGDFYLYNYCINTLIVVLNQKKMTRESEYKFYATSVVTIYLYMISLLEVSK